MARKINKKLIKGQRYKAGRGLKGITVRHKGGRAKRLYRYVDLNRSAKLNVSGRVTDIIYDPNRSARLALIQYEDGDKALILAPHSLKVGDKLKTSRANLPLKPGNRMPLEYIPSGTQVYNLEFQPGKGGQLVRSAGTAAQVMGKEGGKVGVKLPSGEIRLFPLKAMATVGQLSNIEHSSRKLGKAGLSRHLGRRPSVRGTAMPAGAHPHGGGEGRTGTGRPPKTPWGKLARGKKTRKKNKQSDKFIIRPRT